jgi:gluconolactonase
MSAPVITDIADGLEFPEGPVWMPDGSVLVAELRGKRVTRVRPDGTKETVAAPGGSPNGLAIGPDGACYVANSGGWGWRDLGGILIPDGEQPEDYTGGRIERIDLETGDVKVLYTECDGNELVGPNDLVFDVEGGFYFTDHGKHRGRVRTIGALFYATADGGSITEVAFPLDAPNGVGLAPDGSRVYVAETYTGRVHAFDVTGPGRLGPGQVICGLPGMQYFDSLAVDGEGNVVVATLITGALSVIAPDGEVLEQVSAGDPMVTNVCFGGTDLKTAFVTLSATGRLASLPWPRGGLAHAFAPR